MLYLFDEIELDSENFALRRDGVACHIEPLVFDLLLFLTKNSGRVISRDELIQTVWHGRIVSDATVASCIKSARKALGDSGNVQKYIRTIRGRGVEFGANVAIGAPADPDLPMSPAQKSPSGPSLAILPFQVFGDVAELGVIGEGLVENLTMILTRVPLLSLRSCASRFTQKRQAIDALDVGKTLGVRYLLDGSVRKTQDLIRVNVQLIETRNGFHLWAQQFDQTHDGTAPQNLLHSILPRLEMHLGRAIFNDLGRTSGQQSSGQLMLRAMGLLALKGWHQTTFKEAAQLLRSSIKQQPDRALAHAYLALILGLGNRVGLLERSREVVQEAVYEAELALELDDLDSNVVGLAACALADIGQAERAIPLLKKALDLNPDNGHAWTSLGSSHVILGNPFAAIKPLEHGIRISPMDSRLAVWRSILALAYLQTDNTQDALAIAQQGCQSDEKTYLPRVILTAVRLARGEITQATTAMRDCMRIKPDLSQSEVTCLIGPKLGGAFEKLKLLSSQRLS